MSAKSKPHLEQVEQASALDALGRRRNLVRILFIHRSLADVEHCLHKLKRARFTVSSNVVVTPEQFAERIRSELFDLVVTEYPSRAVSKDILHFRARVLAVDGQRLFIGSL